MRTHVIKYAQYHPDPVWARGQLVRVRQPDELFCKVEEVFADRFDEGRPRELGREDAVIPALQKCAGK